MRHFLREKNWHVRQQRKLATRFQDLRRSKNHVRRWRAFVARQKKVTLDENQKVKLDIKIGQDDNETKHSFVKRVANSCRFKQTLKGKTFFST